MKSNLVALFLLCCLVVPPTGTYVWLTYQKITIRREVKRKMINGLDKDELVLLKFTKNTDDQLEWEHSSEFEYQNQMFDVVRSETKGDTTYYWCWPDHEETELNKQLDELLTYGPEKNPQNEESQKRLINFYKSLYYQPLPDAWQVGLFALLHGFTIPAFNYFIVSNSPPVPPPEFC